MKLNGSGKGEIWNDIPFPPQEILLWMWKTYYRMILGGDASLTLGRHEATEIP